MAPESDDADQSRRPRADADRNAGRSRTALHSLVLVMPTYDHAQQITGAAVMLGLILVAAIIAFYRYRQGR